MWTGLDQQSFAALKTEESGKLQEGAIHHQRGCERRPGTEQSMLKNLRSLYAKR